jgi:hypothetical protein
MGEWVEPMVQVGGLREERDEGHGEEGFGETKILFTGEGKCYVFWSAVDNLACNLCTHMRACMYAKMYAYM